MLDYIEDYLPPPKLISKNGNRERNHESTPWHALLPAACFPSSFCVVALAYFAALHHSAALLLRTGLKVGPLVSLASLCVPAADRYRHRVLLGLLLCGVGDILLELDEDGGSQPLFLGGLAAFLAGHLAYVAAFASGKTRVTAAIALPVGAYAAGVFAVLYPHLPPALVAPVAGYALTIAAMATTALGQPDGARLAGVGALSFVVSDTVLAYDRFVRPLGPLAKYVIMLTYYGGQLGIAASAR